MADTVLITGCSSGYGEATARQFAARGWNVVATMRRPEAAAPDLFAQPQVLITRLDVQDEGSIASSIDAAIKRFGHIDAVINNAGFGLNGVFETLPREKILEQFEVNVFGIMDVIRAILPHFRARRSGMIVNITSGIGVFGFPLGSLYSASKFAVEGFSESLAYELAAIGVTIKIVEPGAAPNTGFPARSATERDRLEQIADYEPIRVAAAAVVEGFRTDFDTDPEQKVAQCIFDAVTDGTDQFRYVATDDIRPLIAARRETCEAEYMQIVRGLFMPKSELAISGSGHAAVDPA